MKIALFFAGLIFIGFGLAHFAFPSRFRWREELARLSPLNRQIFTVHCAFIVLTLLLLGALCCCFGGALIAPSALGLVMSAGTFIFVFARFLAQLFVYRASLWRGHAFNAKVHCFFIATWAYLSVTFAAVTWHHLA